MKIKADTLYKEFQQSLREKGIQMEISVIQEVVTQPFLSLREDLNKDQLYVYRLQGFGTFYCSLKTAKRILEKSTEQFKNLNMESTVYFKRKKMLEDFIHRKEKKNEKIS